MAKKTQQNNGEVSRRRLFGASGGLLVGAMAAGVPGIAEADEMETTVLGSECVFDLKNMPADPESGPGGTVQMARQKQFPFMSGATVARLVMQPNCSRSPHWHLNSWEVQFCLSGSC